MSTHDDKALYLELKGRLNSPIAFHPVFARITGSVKAALFLSQSYYWTDIALRLRGNGWFWKSAEEWQVETCLTREEQESCRRQLKGLGILRERYARLEHRMYYRIDLDALCDLVVRDASSPRLPFGKKSNRQSGQSRMGEAGETPVPNRKNFDWKRTETTSKSRRDFPKDFGPQKSKKFEKKQALSASRRARAEAPGGNPSDPRWQLLRNEITKVARQKDMQTAKKTDAWKVLGLSGPIGPKALSATWESRFADWTNQGWTLGKVAFEFRQQCRAYGFEMPEEFQSALMSAIQAEGIPFNFRIAGDQTNGSTSESDNSTQHKVARDADHASGSYEVEAGQENCQAVIREEK